jgi:hypothetical protein
LSQETQFGLKRMPAISSQRLTLRWESFPNVCVELLTATRFIEGNTARHRLAKSAHPALLL